MEMLVPKKRPISWFLLCLASCLTSGTAAGQATGSPTIWLINTGKTVTYDGNGNTGGSVPTDTTTHRAGKTVTTLGNTGSLTKTGLYFVGWNTQADGNGSNYKAGTGTFPMGASNITLYAKWWDGSCAGLAGGTWISVPGDSVYGTGQFCVQKYATSNVGNVATSQSGTTPWTTDQATARSKCAALGSSYHLITNPEWMTIASNIANTPGNWSNNAVGNGTLTRGHSDGSPYASCAADANDANAWVQTNCTGQTQGALEFNQRRTQSLSNGSVVWDFAGNARQWVDIYDPTNKPGGAAWYEYSTLGNGTANWPRSAFVPLNSVQTWWNDSWNSTQGIGQIYPGGANGGALLRGGSMEYSSQTGVFHASMESEPSWNYFVFRCAWP